MDLVTITVPELGYNKKPVRITAIRESDTGELEIDAEDFPWGTATPTLYPQQPPIGVPPRANADPGPVNVPIIFEANDRLSLTGNYEVWIGAAPTGSTNFLIKSEQFDDAAWDRHFISSVTADSVADPLGGQTADAVLYSTTGPFAAIGQIPIPLPFSPASLPWTFSCWLKAASGSPTINLQLVELSGIVIADRQVTLHQTMRPLSFPGKSTLNSINTTSFL